MSIQRQRFAGPAEPGGLSGRRAPASRRAGFTAVELLVAAVAAGVLALTVGSVLVYGYMNWERTAGVVDMQRDLSFAVSMISGAVRQAAPASVSCTGSQLDVGTNSYYRSGNDLIYDPDTGTSGNEVCLVAGTVCTFTPTLRPDGGVSVTLSLRQEDESHTVNTTIAFRRKS